MNTPQSEPIFDEMTQVYPGAHLTDRELLLQIHSQVSTLTARVVELEEKLPGLAEHLQQQIAGTPLGRLLLRGFGGTTG